MSRMVKICKSSPWLACAVLVALLLSTADTQARKPTPKEQALSHLKEGNLRFADGDLEAALENYKLADKFYKSPKIDYSIGNVLFEMKRYAEAELLFKKFLASPGKSSRKLIQAAKKKLKAIDETISSMSKGGLLIKSIPKGATATLDGRSLDGVTPITVKDLAPRMYKLVVEKDGIYQYKTTVQIEPDKYRTFTAMLFKVRCTLDIASDPPEAEIRIDGKFVGLTPKVLKNVDAGPHKLVLAKKGYAKWKQDITVSKGKDKQKIEASLKKLGVLLLQSIPEGAKVYYRTRYIGKTPVKIPAPPKEYVIRFTMPKMETVERTVTVEPGEEVSLAVAMKLSAEEIRRRKAIEEAKKRRAEEFARKKAEALARKKALEEARKRAAAEAARKRKEALERRKAEERRKHELLVAKRKKEAEERRRRKEERRKAEEQRRKAEEQRRKQQEEAKKKEATAAVPAAVDFSKKEQQDNKDSGVPIYKKWWFWTIIGVAVVGGTVGGVVAGTSGGDDWVASGADGQFDRNSFRD